ncbi:hypothetical protein [Ekhidna sp. To15]|uniref:hypothetical protein n=1 Tax=Ekhidna sp. To15 TaxID=3395267 RepID=UPI003F523E34
MKILLITLVLSLAQSPVIIVKNNGDQLDLSNVVIFQSETNGSSNSIRYSYRGEKAKMDFEQLKRISFKETLKRKKGVTTYRVILVKSNNNKLEVEIDLVKLEGIAKSGKVETMNFSSIDKISF